jgi:hypothetical protein
MKYFISTLTQSTPLEHSHEFLTRTLDHEAKRKIANNDRNKLGKISYREKDEHGKDMRRILDGGGTETWLPQTTHIKWKCLLRKKKFIMKSESAALTSSVCLM